VGECQVQEGQRSFWFEKKSGKPQRKVRERPRPKNVVAKKGVGETTEARLDGGGQVGLGDDGGGGCRRPCERLMWKGRGARLDPNREADQKNRKRYKARGAALRRQHFLHRFAGPAKGWGRLLKTRRARL